MKRYALLLWLVSLCYGQSVDTDVLKKWQQPGPTTPSVYNVFCQEAWALLQARRSRISAITDAADFLQYQSFIRLQLQRTVGAFPEATPLHPQITGMVRKPGYRVEKLIFESMPGNYVTACLFIPEKRHGKCPAVLYCSGHSAVSFRSETYQIAILNLVHKGFTVLAFDPAGQGERMQYFDPRTGKSSIGGLTSEHSYVGAQCFLTGYSPAMYWIWDGRRALDYLVSRKEVDARRIGVTGRSGGGTQAAYFAAFDERILASAPECYLTNVQRLFESTGPQDAEQNFLHGLAFGIDHADLLLARAPKPTLMITTTRDMFSIQGARETFKEVSIFYNLLGKSENMQMVEDDTVHASTRRNREALYAFFQKHLRLPGDSTEQALPLLSEKELQVLSQGQTALLADHKTLFDFNRQRAEQLVAQVNEARKADPQRHLSNVRTTALELSGYTAELNNAELVFTGRTRYTDLILEKYFIKEQCLLTPFILLRSSVLTHQKQPLVLLLHPEGKSFFNKEREAVLSLVRRGYAVALPDLAGGGECATGLAPGDSWNFTLDRALFNLWFAGVQVKSSLVGLAARQITLLAFFLRKQEEFGEISAMAFKAMGPVLLHAAAFDSCLQRIALIESPISYADLVLNKYYQPGFMMYAVPAALPVYDLQDLAACIFPRKLVMANGCNSMAMVVAENDIQKAWSFAQSHYQSKGCSENFRPVIGNTQRMIEAW